MRLRGIFRFLKSAVPLLRLARFVPKLFLTRGRSGASKDRSSDPSILKCTMGAKLPYFIGIVGGSCAGKSWLAAKLHDALGKVSARLSLDNFYLNRAHLSERQAGRVNFDHPRSIDWDLFERTLRAFAEGKAIPVPQYDYATHSRLPEGVELRPAPVMILEGLWLFRKPAVRTIFDLRIFVKSSLEICEKRRLERDVRERGRTVEQVLEQFRTSVAPSQVRFVAPQERWANLVLGNPPDDNTVGMIAERVRSELGKRSASL